MTVGQYLARLAAEATTIINAQDYGRTIYELALRRDLIRIGEDMVNVAFDAPVDFAPRAQIEDAERRLYELAESGRYDGGFQRFAQALTVAVDMAAKAYQRDGKLSGIATGLRDLDAKMGGLQPSDLIIVAGRPGMGKTALATNIAYNVAKAYRIRGAGRRHHESRQWRHRRLLLLRNVGRTARHPYSRRTDRHLVELDPPWRHHRDRVRQDSRLFDRTCSTLPLYVDETGGLSISQLTARARRLKRQKGLDLIVVDYIQLLQGSGKRGNDNRVQEVTEITTSLKALAKELNVPVIALSQLSRQVESRDDKHPQLSDLARIRFDRAGRRRGDVRLPRGILPAEQGAEARHARTREVAARNGQWCTARPKSSSPSSATGRPARSSCSSRASSRDSAIWRRTAN